MWLKTKANEMRGVARDTMTQLLGNHFPGASTFDDHRSLKRKLGYNVQLVHSDSDLPNGMSPNKAIDKLKVARRGAYKGPFVAHGVTEFGQEYGKVNGFCDVDTTILPAIGDYLQWYDMMRVMRSTMPPLGGPNGPDFLLGGLIPVFNAGPR
jgi:hypothetical protein